MNAELLRQGLGVAAIYCSLRVAYRQFSGAIFEMTALPQPESQKNVGGLLSPATSMTWQVAKACRLRLAIPEWPPPRAPLPVRNGEYRSRQVA